MIWMSVRYNIDYFSKNSNIVFNDVVANKKQSPA